MGACAATALAALGDSGGDPCAGCAAASRSSADGANQHLLSPRCFPGCLTLPPQGPATACSRPRFRTALTTAPARASAAKGLSSSKVRQLSAAPEHLLLHTLLRGPYRTSAPQVTQLVLLAGLCRPPRQQLAA